jgi:hypothetical protein
MVKCLFVVSRICIHKTLDVPSDKYPEDSSMAGVEAMKWILFYLSIGHDSVTGNTSNSMAEMCRSIIIHVQVFFQLFPDICS